MIATEYELAICFTGWLCNNCYKISRNTIGRFAPIISMGWCKECVFPLLTHWSYVFLALTHRYCITHDRYEQRQQVAKSAPCCSQHRRSHGPLSSSVSSCTDVPIIIIGLYHRYDWDCFKSFTTNITLVFPRGQSIKCGLQYCFTLPTIGADANFIKKLLVKGYSKSQTIANCHFIVQVYFHLICEDIHFTTDNYDISS